jgi:hypothetical protein
MPYLYFAKLKIAAIAAVQKAAPIQRLASEKMTNFNGFSFVERETNGVRHAKLQSSPWPSS